MQNPTSFYPDDIFKSFFDNASDEKYESLTKFDIKQAFKNAPGLTSNEKDLIYALPGSDFQTSAEYASFITNEIANTNHGLLNNDLSNDVFKSEIEKLNSLHKIAHSPENEKVSKQGFLEAGFDSIATEAIWGGLKSLTVSLVLQVSIFPISTIAASWALFSGLNGWVKTPEAKEKYGNSLVFNVLDHAFSTIDTFKKRIYDFTGIESGVETLSDFLETNAPKLFDWLSKGVNKIKLLKPKERLYNSIDGFTDRIREDVHSTFINSTQPIVFDFYEWLSENKGTSIAQITTKFPQLFDDKPISPSLITLMNNCPDKALNYLISGLPINANNHELLNLHNFDSENVSLNETAKLSDIIADIDTEIKNKIEGVLQNNDVKLHPSFKNIINNSKDDSINYLESGLPLFTSENNNLIENYDFVSSAIKEPDYFNNTINQLNNILTTQGVQNERPTKHKGDS